MHLALRKENNMQHLIDILEAYAISHSWSASMYEIVENDIKNKRFKNKSELIEYITT